MGAARDFHLKFPPIGRKWGIPGNSPIYCPDSQAHGQKFEDVDDKLIPQGHAADNTS
jgi:hypothetical protein